MGHDQNLLEQLFDIIRKRSKLKGLVGELEGSSGSRLRKLNNDELPLKPHVLGFQEIQFISFIWR
jgi:hypothetical protein